MYKYFEDGYISLHYPGKEQLYSDISRYISEYYSENELQVRYRNLYDILQLSFIRKEQ